MGNQAISSEKDTLEGRDVRQLDRKTSAALALGVKYNMKILIRGEVWAIKMAILMYANKHMILTPQGLRTWAECYPNISRLTTIFFWQRECGKSQLLRRIEGLPFEDKYTPTPEICTAHVIWKCEGRTEA